MIWRPRFGSLESRLAEPMIASAATRGVDSDGLRYGAIEGRAQPVAIHTCLDIVSRALSAFIQRSDLSIKPGEVSLPFRPVWKSFHEFRDDRPSGGERFPRFTRLPPARASAHRLRPASAPRRIRT